MHYMLHVLRGDVSLRTCLGMTDAVLFWFQLNLFQDKLSRFFLVLSSFGNLSRKDTVSVGTEEVRDASSIYVVCTHN